MPVTSVGYAPVARSSSPQGSAPPPAPPPAPAPAAAPAAAAPPSGVGGGQVVGHGVTRLKGYTQYAPFIPGTPPPRGETAGAHGAHKGRISIR